jgi:hypothetical protein
LRSRQLIEGAEKHPAQLDPQPAAVEAAERTRPTDLPRIRRALPEPTPRRRPGAGRPHRAARPAGLAGLDVDQGHEHDIEWDVIGRQRRQRVAETTTGLDRPSWTSCASPSAGWSSTGASRIGSASSKQIGAMGGGRLTRVFQHGLLHGDVIGLGRAEPTGPLSCSRRWRKASLVLVFTVPIGQPRLAAISDWERPAS